jgi:hypothetical protein
MIFIAMFRGRFLISQFLQELMEVMPATGLRDVTGVEKLLQMQAQELQVCTGAPMTCAAVREHCCADCQCAAVASLTPIFIQRFSARN